MPAPALERILQSVNSDPEHNFHYIYAGLRYGAIKFLLDFVNIFTYNPGGLLKDEIISDTIAGHYYWLAESKHIRGNPMRRVISKLKSAFFET